MIKKLFKPFLYDIVHMGGKLKCTVCGRRSKYFQEAGIIPRQEATCPFCGAVERHRLFWHYIKTQTDFERTPPKSALHVAPEKILEKKMRSLIADRLKEAGFKVQTIAKTDLPGPEEIKIAGLTYWDGRIFICKK